MKILYTSNYQGMWTGYGNIAEELLKRLNRISKHEFVHFAVSGINNTAPFVEEGIKTYGRTNSGGSLGMYDLPVVIQNEDIDLVHMNFDVWAVADDFTRLVKGHGGISKPVSIYAPVDHDPLPQSWLRVFEVVNKVVPYCKWAKQVILNAGLAEDKLHKPIYHGVDTKTFKPIDVERDEMFNEERKFVVMINKNNQGTRAALERMIRGFGIFVQDPKIERDECLLYINSNIQGENSYDLNYVVSALNLDDCVKITNPNVQRYGLTLDQLVALYNASDIVLNTTRGEGFGLGIIEGMACGKPVIATGYSSMPELIADDPDEIMEPEKIDKIVHGPRGILCPVHDVHMSLGKHSWRREVHANTIACALKYAYNNPEEIEEMGKNGREWVKQYDWDNQAKKFSQYFDDLEEELFREEESGRKDKEKIMWKKLSGEDDVAGGVGAFNK